MNVIVYVEGISDKIVLEVLFAKLIQNKRKKNIYISFHEAPAGNKKASVLNKVPYKAADLIAHNDSIVVAMPDLYPKNVGFKHDNVDEIEIGIKSECRRRLAKKNIKDIDYCLERLKVFCFKHDMEVLLLAASEEMKSYLGIEEFTVKWADNVEDQNNNTPPKRIIEQIFQSCGRNYSEKLDAVAILENVNYKYLASKCPECFKPFVDFLDSL